MPSFLSSKAKALFAAAKVDYLAIVPNTSEGAEKFDLFLSNIDNNMSVASAINDRIDSKNFADSRFDGIFLMTESGVTDWEANYAQRNRYCRINCREKIDRF